MDYVKCKQKHKLCFLFLKNLSFIFLTVLFFLLNIGVSKNENKNVLSLKKEIYFIFLQLLKITVLLFYTVAQPFFLNNCKSDK
jgi:hypothetical protein